jgi:hypothetical protein
MSDEYIYVRKQAKQKAVLLLDLEGFLNRKLYFCLLKLLSPTLACKLYTCLLKLSPCKDLTFAYKSHFRKIRCKNTCAASLFFKKKNYKVYTKIEKGKKKKSIQPVLGQTSRKFSIH